VIVICYDGSADARAAIERAAELMPGQRAAILCVWQQFVDVLARTSGGYGMAPGVVDFQAVDEATSGEARGRAEEGAEVARRAGLDAEPVIRTQGASIAGTILAEADAVNASAIVMGSRGLTRVKSLLLGSVSHAVIQRADRAVLVVPSPEVAESRSQRRRDFEEPQ